LGKGLALRVGSVRSSVMFKVAWGLPFSRTADHGRPTDVAEALPGAPSRRRTRRKTHTTPHHLQTNSTKHKALEANKERKKKKKRKKK
jgi:hypothetical protein